MNAITPSRATLRLGAACLAIVAVGLSACATYADRGAMIARIGTTSNYTVKVNFDASGCPTSVSPPTTTCTVGTGFCVKKGRSVQWESEPAGNPFQIYFDPFVGRPYSSNPPDERTPPIRVRRDSASGDYKYGVYGTACSGGSPVLDPAMRIED